MSDKRAAGFYELAAGMLVLVISSMALAQGNSPPTVEAYRAVSMPTGFRVEYTALDGPVFADAEGKTLYKWPQHKLRNGYSGEAAGVPACFDEVLTVTAGLMSPYPPGILLPELESRPSCTDLWPPVLADEGADPVGKWTVILRRDGELQWAYDEQPLYTSIRDQQPGDALGGDTRKYGQDSPARRVPVGPPPLVPPGFAVKSTPLGRLLTTTKNESVYAFDRDTANSIACLGVCLNNRKPLLAPSLVGEMGEWSTVERSPGTLQWTYRGQPLYTHTLDLRSWSQEGSDDEGWRNVYTQRAPAYPDQFTVQPTLAGEVLADAAGKTIYTYVCGEDSADQLACDHPEDTQVYRLAMCGGGSPQKCRRHWPYVPAQPDADDLNQLWTILHIDPETGRKVSAEAETALRVWAYRDRPIYTYGPDLQPGDVHGHGTGEWRGLRNGLLAFWLRDDYLEGTL